MTISAARITKPPRKLDLAIEPKQIFHVSNVTWEQYVAIADAFPNRACIRVTYDNGNLELMTTSWIHEIIKSMLSRLVDVLMDEFGIEGSGAGQFTHRREDLAKAIEPDACFYTKSWPKVRGRESIDLTRDPPPDLAIEIDVASSSVKRMPIYEALGVPELWRFKDATIVVYVRNRAKKYREVKDSPTFPGIPMAELVRFVRLGIDDSGTAMIRAFRHWVRERLAAK